MDPYKILGVAKNSTRKEIRSAYLKLAAKYHPDAGGEVWVFLQIRDAYEQLTGEEPVSTATKDSSSKNDVDKSRESQANQKDNSKKSDSEPDFQSFDTGKSKGFRNTKSRKKSGTAYAIGIVGGLVSALILTALLYYFGVLSWNVDRIAITRAPENVSEREPLKGNETSANQSGVQNENSNNSDADASKNQNKQDVINQNKQDVIESVEDDNSAAKPLNTKQVRPNSESNSDKEKKQIQVEQPGSVNDSDDQTNVQNSPFAEVKVDSGTFKKIDLASPIFSDREEYVWYSVPARFRGWRYARVPFLKKSAEIKITSNGVVFVLIFPPWIDPNSADSSDQNFISKSEFKRRGWSEFSEVGIDGVLQFFALSDNEGNASNFEIWMKQVEKGESLSLKVSEHISPIVIIPGDFSDLSFFEPIPSYSDASQLARGTVELSEISKLVLDEKVFSDSEKYKWHSIPDKFIGWGFTQLPIHHKKSTIRIDRKGRIYVLVKSDWGGGGKDGEWQAELTSKEDFIKQGWVKDTAFGPNGEEQPFLSVNTAGDVIPFEVWSKELEPNTFTLRTVKYTAPMVIFPSDAIRNKNR